MSILDDIQSAVIGAFGPSDPNSAFRPAVLTKITKTGSVLMGGETRDDVAVRAFPSNYTEAAAARIGVPDGNIKIAVLAKNDLGEKVVIETGDVITTTDKLAGVWIVELARLDPSEAVWSIQAKPA